MSKENTNPRELIQAAYEKAYTLYEGKMTPHRSCGICLAETFNLPTQPYQALRRGGITGEGECGAIKAGELILGQYFGDPDPTGAVTERLREAIQYYQQQWKQRIDRGDSPDIICNHLTQPFGDFTGDLRKDYCTRLASQVAEIVAETLLKYGAEIQIAPVAETEKQPL